MVRLSIGLLLNMIIEELINNDHIRLIPIGKQVRLSTSEIIDFLRGTPHFDKTFFDLLRRRMEQDLKRARNSSNNRPPTNGLVNAYFAPFSIISFLIGFGILIHVFQGR